MNKDFSNILLGYRDYNQDEIYGKDIETIDIAADWIDNLWDGTADTTKEFWDFLEQRYGIQATIDKMKEKYPGFPYYGDRSPELLEKQIRTYFDQRDLRMKAAQFTDVQIPQVNNSELPSKG